MIGRSLNTLLKAAIALVWLVNGVYCKVLGMVPRHREIVARILGETYADELTLAIGLAEIGMVVWVVSGVASRLNAIMQMSLVATMNVLEFILAPDLLLWGRFNALFAGLFILIVWYREFCLEKS